MNKKILLLLSIVFCFGLAGCQNTKAKANHVELQSIKVDSASQSDVTYDRNGDAVILTRLGEGTIQYEKSFELNELKADRNELVSYVNKNSNEKRILIYSNHDNVIPYELFNEIQGKNTILYFYYDKDTIWTINGLDVKSLFYSDIKLPIE